MGQTRQATVSMQTTKYQIVHQNDAGGQFHVTWTRFVQINIYCTLFRESDDPHFTTTTNSSCLWITTFWMVRSKCQTKLISEAGQVFFLISRLQVSLIGRLRVSSRMNTSTDQITVTNTPHEVFHSGRHLMECVLSW